jgi:phenylalanyl-tRNA synthetase beta chain
VLADLPSGGRAELGRVGEVHPALLAAFDIRADRVVVAEIDLEAVLALVPERRRVGSLERLPVVERDIAVIVDEHRPAVDVETVIRAAAGPLLRHVRLFDRYQGAPLAEDKLSLAYRLTFQPLDQAGADTELEQAVERIVRALEDRLGGQLRA